MSRRPYIGPSDAQANADALARRGRTYADANSASMAIAWDYSRRVRPSTTLRELVIMARQLCADETPTRLHNRDLADDGTPKMTPQAEAFIFGSPTRTDAGHPSTCECSDEWKDAPIARRALATAAPSLHTDACPADPAARPVIAYYQTPFRAMLDNMEHASEPEAKRAAIVRHVTIGSQGPQEAAIAEGVPAWCAKLVSEDALRSFLRRLTDIRVDVSQGAVA